MIPLLENGNLITHALHGRTARAVAVRDGRIVAAGNPDRIRRLGGAGTRAERVAAGVARHRRRPLSEGRLPTRTDLDPVSPDNPVYIPRGGHVCAVNGTALELAGITRDTKDPEGGVIVRDGNGEPTGVLLERARSLVPPHLPAPPPAETQKRLLREQMTEHNSPRSGCASKDRELIAAFKAHPEFVKAYSAGAT